jgi:acyl-CoA dehydrogenase
MDFEYSEKTQYTLGRIRAFMDEHIYPNEQTVFQQLEAFGSDRWQIPPILEELKEAARKAGLWNLFLPDSERGGGFTNLEYAPMCEEMGRVNFAAEVFNCSAPDTGNMEVLERYGSEAQKKRWLEPLLAGEIRSAFAMTEPDVASSDATNIRTEIRREGDEYLINGRKWWTSGILDPRCKLLIVMGRTNPDAPSHVQQSQILVDRDTPGITIERGFEIAQGRLGPGRIHHCMRTIGIAERALELMCERLLEREAFGKKIAEHSVWEERVADARIEIECARLLTLKAAYMMDTVGNKVARSEIAMIKVKAPIMALQVIDDAIQAFGGAGVTTDFGLAAAYAAVRTLRLADGPDEVHRRTIAKLEYRKAKTRGEKKDAR